jgi:hypothetical protein
MAMDVGVRRLDAGASANLQPGGQYMSTLSIIERALNIIDADDDIRLSRKTTFKPSPRRTLQ